ncbi:MAG: exodeoxyribonuclease V subunit gamma, partial [Nocardioidaceae bacterium]
MLKVHRAERADALVRGLAALLADTPDDPFTPDVVAVPSKGVERWIAQTLSASLGASADRADGVCANVVFPQPRRLVADALAASVGVDPGDDPWAERRLTWPLLEVIDGCATEPWCATLGRHLGLVDGTTENGRRVAVAQKLAGLFTTYGAERPTMLREWANGDDTDGMGDALDADLRWQPELWRRLRTTIEIASPAERLGDATRRLRDEPDVVDLPDRLSVFGPTRLTAEQLRVLDALAAHRDIHLWLPHPSHGMWDRLAGRSYDGAKRRDDPTVAGPEHPLASSMARDAREMQLRLTEHVDIAADAYVGADTTEPTLLGTLQRDLHEDRAPSPGTTLAADDRSVQVHACHGRQRQVEVLREVLLGMLDDDPTLELRDIIVMCPDIESWAPLISASFGLADDELDDAHPGHRLKVRLADRSLRQTNPVLTVIARLLELVDGRLAASELLDLAAMSPVRRRFGFDDEALERIGDWVRKAGVRWGLDAEHRAPYGLDAFGQNTWRAGLDRLLVGITMDEEELRSVGLALPLDDVDSNEIDLAGRLAELIGRVDAIADRLTREQPLEAWVDALVEVVEALTDVPFGEEWQISHARWQLTDALTSAGARASRLPLRLPDIRALLGRRLEGRPTRANFRTGHLTMCTMVPMRSVPHRVVCLLGLDDGVFPRGSGVDGDDVLSRSPRVGERDPRSEDRQLFLDAILAARERLVVLYTGADERTGAERPPSVPLGELLDTLDRTAHTEDGSVRERVLIRHPLQPFDARNFEAGTLGTRGPFSFDTASYEGTRAALRERTEPGPFLRGPLADEPLDVVELPDLIGFLEHPAKSFLQRRLGLSSLRDAEESADALAVEIDALQKWAVGDRLLQARLSGVAADVANRAEWLRGELPPGRLGREVIDPIAADVERLVASTAGLLTGTPATVDVTVDVEGRAQLVGAVSGVRDHNLVRIVYSKLGAKHRLRAWVQLLALTAGHPDEAWTATTVGRSKGGIAVSTIVGVTPEQARTELASLLALHREGRREPLPLAAKTSGAYAEKRHKATPIDASQAWAAGSWRAAIDGREFGDF